MDIIKNGFGIIKIIIGIASLLIGAFVLIMMLKENANNLILLIGNILGFLCMEFYGFYLLYNGWTQIKKRSLHKAIFIIGLVMNIIIVLTTASLFLAERFTSPVYTRILIISVVLFIGITDIIRMKRQRTTSYNNAL